MKSPERLRWFALGFAFVSIACSEPAPPNIVLVSIDTLRADHTTPYGYTRDTTPTLAAFAAAGTTFEVAYAPTSTTAPTHATLFTSLSPIAHGLVKNGLVLAPSLDTLAETLRDAGYRTGGFPSSLVLGPAAGFDQGFEVYDVDFEAASSKTADHPESVEVIGSDEVFDRRAAATTDRAVRWLDSTADGEEPFLLFVHYFDPHAPYLPEARFAEPFESGEAPETLNYVIDQYDGEIAYTDHHMGRLLDAVDAIDPGALVVVTADHGEGLSDHGVMTHGVHIYEAFVRVPLLVRWPGRVEAGRRVAEPVDHRDVMPTLLDAAGVASPMESGGRSLAGALLRSEQLDPEYPIHLLRRHYEPQRVDGVAVKGMKFGLRKGRFKYLEAPAEGTRELYDVENDPREQFDLTPFASETAKALGAELDAWRQANRRDTAVESVSDADRQGLEALGYVE